MRSYLARRLIALVPVLLVVAVVVFLLIHLTPGDPAASILGDQATPDQIAAVRRQLGLDQPLPIQFLRWFGRALRGDLGWSIFLDRPVGTAIAERIPVTITLTLFAELIAVLVAVPAGIIAAARHNTWADRLFMFLALLGVSIPGFWLAVAMILLFAVTLRWLPVAGYQPLSEGGFASLRYLLMPAVSLGFMQAALIARMTRSSMLEVLRQDFVRTARAKGLRERAIIYKHAFRNALIPVITVVGLSFAVLMGGAIIIEKIFTLPGMGRLVVTAVQKRDYPVVQGVVLLTAGVYVLINLAVDLTYAWIDPRVRYQ